MSEISATQVKELRDLTGAGMMDAKRALQETEGDLEGARKLLRERGMAAAGKRAGRETTEGEVLVTIAENVGAIVAVGCETEPVSKNEEFLAFAEQVLEVVLGEGPEAAQKVEEARVDLVTKLGENIVVRGADRFEGTNGAALGEYVHPPGNKIGVLVKVRGEADPAAVRRLAMHIASAGPRWARRDEVPEDVIASEREIFLNSDEVQGKPEQAREKIVEGMLNKRFFAAYPGGVLTEQAWIHDGGKSVGQALEEEGLEVVEFVRYALAE
ncbi:MAG: translation elongation factor Ts [Actinomycetota bacterium]|nr:translation elongation factor Ts [Actinomycetota bacterium]